MDWDNVRCFLAVAHTGSLTEGAARLRISPATLGRRIQALEKDLSAIVFVRHSAGYTLTAEGRALLPRAEAIEEAMGTLAAAGGSNALSGRVRLATAENLANHVVVPHLPAFRAACPDLVLEIATGIRSIGLTRREADIALRLVRPAEGRLRVRKVGVVAHAAYVRRDLPGRLAEGPARLGVIGWDEAYDHLPAAAWLRAALPGHPTVLTATSVATQMAAVRAGLGVAVLPCFVADRDPSLCRLGAGFEPTFQDLWLIVHADAAQSGRVRAVADFLVRTVEREERWLRGDGVSDGGGG